MKTFNIQKIIKLPRLNKILLVVFFDLSFLLLLSFNLTGFFNHNLYQLFFILTPIAGVSIFFFLGLYRAIFRYFGFNSLIVVFKATSIYSLFFAALAFFLFGIQESLLAVLVHWALVFVCISVSRMTFRLLLTDFNRGLLKNVLIYGAGSAGRQLMDALKRSHKFNIIGFIDDSEELIGKTIDGLLVYPNEDVPKIIHKYNVMEVFLAIPSLKSYRRSEIINSLKIFPIRVMSLPSLTKIVDGVVKVEQLSQLKIEDLLGRPKASSNLSLMSSNIDGKSVMVTGAGGSIGSELCRQALLFNPKILILLDISESALYLIDKEIQALNKLSVKIIQVIASVRDSERMKKIISEFNVQTIYHSAAYKHVPLVEFNPTEGVLNNSIGTRNIAEVAVALNVETFVLISSDKAVRPTNTMGASKSLAEKLVLSLSKEKHNTTLTMVRFGNVLNSSGSVIPLFRDQIAKGGPITLTDKKIVRYFMTVQESVELVIQSGAMSSGGDIFILDMGEPILIYDMAVKMIELSGLEVISKENPNGDIAIKITGLRPGEKLYEELLTSEASEGTINPLIMRAFEPAEEWSSLRESILILEKASLESNVNKTREILLELVPDFAPREKNIDFSL